MTRLRPHPGTTASTSLRLASVRRSGTLPEMKVRALFVSAGVRFRANVRGLPGTPDLVNKSLLLAVFVHGCFWHGHPGCARAKLPVANRWWWTEKLRENRARDMRKARSLRELGFCVATIWECELRRESRLHRRIQAIVRHSKREGA